jgi:DNA-binding beta-propeller fold protein YncE
VAVNGTNSNVWVADHDSCTVSLLNPQGAELLRVPDLCYVEGMAVEPESGQVWIADGKDHYYVVRLREDGTESYRSEEGFFGELRSVALAPDGSVWVSDAGNHRVVHLDAEGAMLCETDVGMVHTPTGISVHADGSIWVADMSFGQATRLASDCSEIARTTRGGLGYPEDVVVDPRTGGVWATDSYGGYVVAFSNRGVERGRTPSHAYQCPVALAVVSEE